MIRHYLKSLVSTAESNYLNNIYSTLKSYRFNVVLDVGCYTGENTQVIGNLCSAKKLIGLEINKNAAAVARKKGITVIPQDIEKKWKIKDGSVDFVYSNQVIEHLYSVDNYISNTKRVLRRGGCALISTENLAGWHNIFALALGFQPFSLTNISTSSWSIGNPLSVTKEGHHDLYMIHRSEFTYYALKQFLTLYKMEVLKELVSGYYPFPNSIGNRIAKMDPRHSVYMAFLVKKS